MQKKCHYEDAIFIVLHGSVLVFGGSLLAPPMLGTAWLIVADRQSLTQTQIMIPFSFICNSCGYDSKPSLMPF